ncbi:hypothetical protein FRC08_013812 [Ceratobasidium sp. 394]|nr:hypothetical protein FRC08_013812 [Ceratobasidium sp. 394]
MNRALAAGGDARAYKQYQVIAGTGTGALNACMLGLLQIDVEQAISTYARLVEHVFSDKKMISTSGSGTFKASKMEEELKKIVRDVTGDEDTRMMSTSLDGEDCKMYVVYLA